MKNKRIENILDSMKKTQYENVLNFNCIKRKLDINVMRYKNTDNKFSVYMSFKINKITYTIEIENFENKKEELLENIAYDKSFTYIPTSSELKFFDKYSDYVDYSYFNNYLFYDNYFNSVNNNNEKQKILPKLEKELYVKYVANSKKCIYILIEDIPELIRKENTLLSMFNYVIKVIEYYKMGKINKVLDEDFYI